MKKRNLTTSQVAMLMAILAIGSKVLGFIRELVLAYFFGAGYVVDAYEMGMSIPITLLNGIVIATSTSYMPLLAVKYKLGGVEKANIFTSKVINSLLVIILSITLVAFLFSKSLIVVFAPGFNSEKASLTAFYMRVAFFAVMINAIIYILQAYLEYNEVFHPQILVGYLQNLVIISFTFLAAFFHYHLLIFGMAFGYLANCIGFYLLAKNKGFEYKRDLHIRGTLSEIINIALPVFIGQTIGEINSFVDKVLASNLNEGSISALKYSSTVLNMVIYFVVTILITIIYPKLNKAFSLGRFDDIERIFNKGISILLIVAIPVTIGAVIYCEDLISVIYERGAFDSSATRLAAVAFGCYSIGLPFCAIRQLMLKAFYSLHEMKIPMVSSIIAFFVNLILDLSLVNYIGVAGLAISTSVAESVAAGIMYFFYKRKYEEIKINMSISKVLCVLLVSAISIGTGRMIYILLSDMTVLIIRLLIAVIVSIATYVILLAIVKFEEVTAIRELISGIKK